MITLVYPKVVLTVVFIPTVVYIQTVVSSLCDYSSQHSPHSLAISFHVIFISAYPAVQVKLYATVGLETAVRIESTVRNGNEHADR